jgi:hypothetical protein
VDVHAPADARECSFYCALLPLNFLTELVAPRGLAALAPRTNVTVRNVSTAHIQRRYGYDGFDAGFGLILTATRCSALALAKGKTVNVRSRV